MTAKVLVLFCCVAARCLGRNEGLKAEANNEEGSRMDNSRVFQGCRWEWKVEGAGWKALMEGE